LYNNLKLNEVAKQQQKHTKSNFDINSILQLLIYSRILYPGSKKETFDNKNIFFDDFNFSLIDVYRSLDIIASIKDNVEKELWKNTKEKYTRTASTAFYDCTNYYFEISNNDKDLVDEEGNIIEKGYGKKGYSKENRRTPIIQMGLLMDSTGIPLSYNIFPGNESEKTPLRPILKKSKTMFNLKRVVVVADRGINTSDNTVFIAGKNNYDNKLDGYIFGQTIRGADKEFRNWALDKKGYITEEILDAKENKVRFIHKSRIFAKTTQIEKDGKRDSKFDIYQKQLVYYSEKYAEKQRYDREKQIEIAKDLIKYPKKYNKANSKGAASYVKNIQFVKKTGEIAEEQELSIDTTKIEEEKLYDGYYSIVTSELEMSDKDIRDKYKGLWEIEETFKITKSTLKTRPVYVWTKEHIEEHFLICFISLIMLRILEKDMQEKYTSEKIIKSLKKYTSTKVEYDIYLQSHRDEIIKYLEQIYNIDLSKKYLTLSRIKQILQQN